MKPNSFFQHVSIDAYSATPKYLQLINSIMEAISVGKIQKNELLPSINELSYNLEISRDTAEKSYKHLKTLGVLTSVPGKGYYTAHVNFMQKLRIFLLFNKLSAHKKIIYDAFVSALGEYVTIDFYIYNNDFSLFKKLLNNAEKNYSHYVIIPHFIEGGEESHKIINSIPKEKLVLLDKQVAGVEGDYSSVCENFEKDIYHALEQAKKQLSKYHTLKLVFPDKSYFPREIIRGFYRFCQQYAFSHKLVNDINQEPIGEGEVFINLMEGDLVTLIERIVALKLKIGKQVGVISYNETPLKKLILNGITTISTDFQKMGEMAAQMIVDGSRTHQEVPFHLTLRASL